MKPYIRILLALLLVLLGPATEARSQTADDAPAEDFVRAYVVVATPGEILYSALGHACLRLHCPDHGLDFIFSNEAESEVHNIARFFAGRLRMAVRAVPTADYLQQYREEGRGVRQYELCLPIAVKQRLWQQMDERLQYSDIPYDYMNDGCAVSVMHWLEDAIERDSLRFAPWPAKFERSRKEIGGDSIANPWTHALLFTIGEGEAYYTDVRNEDKCIVPTELVEVLQSATAYGRPLLSREAETLLAPTRPLSDPAFTPTMLGVLLALLALANLRLRSRTLRISLWTLMTLCGLFITYMWLLSDLPCSQWSLLFVVLNPLPALLWRWRKVWALPYAAVCLVWTLAVLCWPHRTVDMVHILLAVTVLLLSVECTPAFPWAKRSTV